MTLTKLSMMTALTLVMSVALATSARSQENTGDPPADDPADFQRPPNDPGPPRRGERGDRNRGPGGFDRQPGDFGRGGPNRPPHEFGSRDGHGPNANRPGPDGQGPGPGRRAPHGWQSMQQRDPEMFKMMKSDHDLNQEAIKLSQQFRRSPEDQRENLKTQLSEVVNKHFDVRQKRRALELKRVKKELDRLQSAIDRRNDARDEIVGRRVAELTGERNDLDF